MRRLLITLAASVALTLGQALPIRADGLTLVTVSCSDGENFSASVDANTLSGLQQAVQAMTLYPAGLNCTLATAPLLTAIGGVASASTGASGFVVGGGRFQLACPDNSGNTFWTNFGLSARNVDGTRDVNSGTFNLSIPDGPTQCVAPSNFTSKPNCLVIDNTSPGPPSGPWWAWINSTVTEVHGDFFTTVAGLRPGSTHGVGVKDTGNPGQQTVGPDRIAPRPFPTACPDIGGPPEDDSYFGWHDVLNGNVTIHPQS
jgi:hypothetical protein